MSTKPTVTFPVEIELSNCKCFMPTLQKLTLQWPRMNQVDRDLYSEYFLKEQQVHIGSVIEFAHEYRIVEPDYSNVPDVKVIDMSKRPLKEHPDCYYEEQYRMIEAQKLK
jgi:hypothetical protein